MTSDRPVIRLLPKIDPRRIRRGFPWVYANELVTAVSENFGLLTVRHTKDGRALPKVYVKVYAMTGSGPKFYKDGYTDLRGKFDYASVSTTDIGGVSKFSLLVMSDDHGATVLEAPVPQR